MGKNLLSYVFMGMFFLGFPLGNVASEANLPKRVLVSGDLPILLKNMPPLKLEKRIAWKEAEILSLPASGFDWKKRGRYDKPVVNVTLFGDGCEQRLGKSRIIQSRKECKLNSGAVDLGSFTKYAVLAEEGVTSEISISNNCSEAVTITGHALINVPPNMNVTLAPVGNSWIIPPHSRRYIFLTLRYDSAQVFVPGSYAFHVKFYSSAGAGTLKASFNLVESSYVLDVLERGIGQGDKYSDAERGLIAYAPDDGGYRNGAPFPFGGEPLTEQMVAGVPASIYSKKGLAADGNARLMLRYRTTVPNTCFIVGFPYTASVGMRMERLDGSLLTLDNNAAVIPAISVGNNLYQATVVLVAPQGFDYFSYPADSFAIASYHAREVDDGYYVMDLGITELQLWAPPVLLLHGLYGSARTFGSLGASDKTAGVLSQVLRAGWIGFFEIDPNYVGPSEFMVPTETKFYDAILKRIGVLNLNKIACTRVDIVSHSMGGLMARKFVADNLHNQGLSSYGNGTIHRLVTIATPHEGSLWVSYLTGDFDRLHFQPSGTPTGVQQWFLDLRKKVAAGLHNLCITSFNVSGNNMFRILKDPSFIIAGEEPEFTRDEIVSGITDLEPNSPLLQYLSASSIPKVPTFYVAGLARDALFGRIFYAPAPQYDAEHLGLVKLSNPDFFFGLPAKLNPPTDMVLYDLEDIFRLFFGADEYDLIVSKISALHAANEYNGWRLEGEGLEGMHTNIGAWKEAGNAALYALQAPSEVYAGAWSMGKGKSLTEGDTPIRDTGVLESPKILLHDYPYSDKKLNNKKCLFSEKKIAISLVKNPIQVGEEFVLHGNVIPNPPVANGEIIIEVFDGSPSLTSLFSAGKRLVKTNLDENGRFTFRAGIDKPGRYTLLVRMVELAAEQLIASQAIELYVVPHVGAISLLYFRDDLAVVSEGGKDVLPLLIAQGKDEDWEVSSPALFGTSYSFEDPLMAKITAEGLIEGIKPGRTVMHAHFRGQRASIPVLITPKPVPLSETLMRLRQPIQPQPPVPLEPALGSSFSKGEKVIFRATPFDTSRGDVMSSSFWQVREVDGKRIVADLRKGSESYAEWIPPRAGIFEWSMSYFHSRGRTEETPWVKFTIQD